MTPTTEPRVVELSTLFGPFNISIEIIRGTPEEVSSKTAAACVDGWLLIGWKAMPDGDSGGHIGMFVRRKLKSSVFEYLLEHLALAETMSLCNAHTSAQSRQ